MKQKKILFFCFIFFCSFSCCYIQASIFDYIYPHQKYSFTNYGGIGLIQNPSSRFLKESSLAFSLSHNDPYLRGSVVAYPFSWLEASYQYTEINNQLYSEIKEFSGTQSFKDKAFDVKIRLLKESQYIPQVAVGLRDIGGTGLFSSEYIAVNKLINNIDFTWIKLYFFWKLFCDELMDVVRVTVNTKVLHILILV